MQYDIVWSNDYIAFKAEVNAKLVEDWKPYGLFTPKHEGGKWFYFQAIVKHDDDDEE